MCFSREFFICEDPKGRIMNTASDGTSSQKISVGKPGLSLVRDAKPKLLDQLREALRARHYSRRWQWVFPQENRWINIQTREQGRHHIDESVIQIKEAPVLVYKKKGEIEND